MQKVALKDLKRNLSSWLERVAKGEWLEITRYNEPYVRVIGSENPSVHYGSRVGAGELRSVLKRRLKISSLEVLAEDRDMP